MNIVTVTGNLGKDASLRSIPSGDNVLQFSVADSQGKDKPSIWWNCSLWGKRADTLSQYLVKGQQVTVIGQVTEREYQKDGETKKSMEIRVTDIALQGGKRDAAPATPKREARPAPPKADSGFSDMDDDLPFVSCAWELEVDTSKSKRMRSYDY